MDDNKKCRDFSQKQKKSYILKFKTKNTWVFEDKKH